MNRAIMASRHHNCVYMNCSNNNRFNKDISFFKFPVADVGRATVWQERCGNMHIAAMDISDLKNRMICELHFSQNYLRTNKRRKLLTKTAVPLPFIPKGTECECDDTLPSTSDAQLSDPPMLDPLPSAAQNLAIGEHTRSYSRKRRRSDSDSKSTCSITCTMPKISEEILPMESSMEDLLSTRVKIHKNTRANRSKMCRYKKISISSNASATLLLSLLMLRSSFVRTFINMQLYHKKCTRWTKDEQQLALALYNKSPGTYIFMIQFLGFVLPSVRTIHSWQKMNLEPGISTDLQKKLSLKTKTMEDKERKVVVMFDEIKLKPQLKYSRVQDKIEGYEDLGSFGQCAKIADTALVFLIRGVLHNWRMPLCYFPSSGPVSSECLQKLVSEVIQKLKEMTFTPLVLVCDQNSNNREAMKLLGATKDEPAVEVEGQKIFTCFGVTHLLMSLRNTFMNAKLQFLVNKMAIAWTDIIETYQIVKLNKVAQVMVKITDAHIWPTNFQKTRVKYAAQIFSNTVAAAIQTASRIGQITSKTALATAQCIKKITNIFDALNSKIVEEPTSRKKPLITAFNNSTVDLLQNGLDFFKSIEIFENNEIRNIFCIDGFQWTINSILQLWNYLKDSGVKYLLTGFLNKDPLEQFFSLVRHRGGYNPTPTIRQLRIAMQHNMRIRLQTNVDSESNIREGENLDVYDEEINEESTETANISYTAPSPNFEETSKTSTEMLTHSLSLETCSSTYVAGYLAYEIEKRYMCDYCATLTKYGDALTNERELFLLLKDYIRQDTEIKVIKTPTDQFAEIVTNLLLEFTTAFNEYKCKRGILCNIENHLKNYLFTNYSNWCQAYFQGECKVHMQYMLKLFIKKELFRNINCESSNKQDIKAEIEY